MLKINDLQPVNRDLTAYVKSYYKLNKFRSNNCCLILVTKHMLRLIYQLREGNRNLIKMLTKRVDPRLSNQEIQVCTDRQISPNIYCMVSLFCDM